MNVSLNIVDQQLEMIISDNGKGFVVKGIENKKTLGILGMRERMTIINGEYNIDSTPGNGTRVMVSVPLESIETY
jgi:signal transduction histidine kinase